MIITHNEIEYEVSALSGWHSHLYPGLSLDVLKILAEAHVGLVESFKDIPHTIVHSYEYFVKFCLSTKANEGLFSEYSIVQLLDVYATYQIWLRLFSEEGFYDAWLAAYLHENREEETKTDQKKEQNIEVS